MAEAMPGNQPAPTMEDFAAFEQMRQEISPSEFNETMLATAAEADPMAVAEFKSELRLRASSRSLRRDEHDGRRDTRLTRALR